jgi:hypothetical protein
MLLEWDDEKRSAGMYIFRMPSCESVVDRSEVETRYSQASVEVFRILR